MNAPDRAELDSAQRLHADLAAGKPRALSRALSWVENGDPGAQALLALVYGASAPTPWVIGITGVGGAGKSSLVPHLARHFAEGGARVVVLAVDPSSPLSGGALLGDRIRDAAGAAPANVFFRSVASRGGQGGLAVCVADLIRVAAVGGRDIVLVETVGAGQSELGVLDIAHTVLLVSAPGLGDDVQAQKAGVMEVAHVFAVNKADRPGAADTAASLRQALTLSERVAHMREGANTLSDGQPHWQPPVLSTVALTGQGVDALCARLSEHRDLLEATGQRQVLDRQRDLRRMQAHFQAEVQRRLAERIATLQLMPALEARLAQEGANPLLAAEALAEAVLAASSEALTAPFHSPDSQETTP
ncbi:methylmalonyl Co-A mutase-associated GTPase MeaB [Hydrogenophaga sp. BPS33]|uniref:methylmalonyl Co-A mutase-associated GTPase MeaB n=1 Tax=Hydrogenophaga sp. BPS33 TaxID=2651974 RepID=UPI00131FE27D|nr:methylmalonyl Co-A mutase-associated GTPase MeaB [Hydrogenophaga sp. BPS33]QHE83697.1 methylmalonyl Co-A mutase-associated GTPase MeaB [Hydrogenophaga sp. BPS33]